MSLGGTNLWGGTIDFLQLHQRAFALALIKFPKKLNVPKLVFDKSHWLFLMGLTDHHFDLTIGHFVDSFAVNLRLRDEIVDNFIRAISPLRKVIIKTGKLTPHKGFSSKLKLRTTTRLFLESLGLIL